MQNVRRFGAEEVQNTALFPSTVLSIFWRRFLPLCRTNFPQIGCFDSKKREDLLLVKRLGADYIVCTAVNITVKLTCRITYGFSVVDAAASGAVQADGAAAVSKANQRTRRT